MAGISGKFKQVSVAATFFSAGFFTPTSLACPTETGFLYLYAPAKLTQPAEFSPPWHDGCEGRLVTRAARTGARSALQTGVPGGRPLRRGNGALCGG